MSAEEFVIRIDELDGYTLIETIFPHTIDFAKLAPSIVTFFSALDQDRRSVAITDVSLLDAVTPEFHQVLLTILRRAQITPGFLAGVWVTGDKPWLRQEVAELLGEVDRSATLIHEKREDAVEHLRGIIRSREVPRA